jgi:hypothetical protein
MGSRAAVVFAALALAACGGSEDNPGEGESFTVANWSTLVSDPEAHKGADAEIVGKVFTEPERDEEATYWQMWAKPKSSDWNTVVGIKNPNFKISNNDYVRVKGVVAGELEAENAFGGKVSGVTIAANSAEVLTALEAATPPTKTLPSKQQTVGNDILVTVEKVEIAPDETRVFVTVKNDSTSNFSLYQHTAKLVVGGQQHEAKFAPEGYPELPSETVGGATSNAVIVFDPIDANQPTEFRIDGYSNDLNIGKYGAVSLKFTWP